MSKKENEEIKEAKREIVLDSINFFRVERNKELFRINAAKLKRKEAVREEKEAIKKSRLLKKRMFDEVTRNLDILKKEDTDGFIIE